MGTKLVALHQGRVWRVAIRSTLAALIATTVLAFPPAGFEIRAGCGKAGSVGAANADSRAASILARSPDSDPASRLASPFPAEGNGLYGRYYFSGFLPSRVEIDPLIDFDVNDGFEGADFEEQFDVIWVGWFEAISTGTYTFQVSAETDAGLLIDGNAVSAPVSLDAGKHPIALSLHYGDCGQDPAIHFEYEPPGATEFSLVPTGYLYANVGPFDSQLYGPGLFGWTVNPSGDRAEPVNTATGNYYTSVTDLHVPAPGLPFDITRTYNSLDPATGILGQGWSINLGAHLDFGTDGFVNFVADDGAVLPFADTGGFRYGPLPGVNAELLFVPGSPDTYALTRNDGLVYVFDDEGHLASKTDLHGNTALFDYEDDELQTVTDPVGRVFTLDYEDGLLTSVTDPAERQVLYGYDINDRLHTVTDLDDGVTTYDYDGDGRLETIVDQNEHTLVTNTYDSLTGRVVSQVDARGKETIFDWDEGTQTATMTDPLDGDWVDVYDANRLVSRSDPLDHTTSYDYDIAFHRIGVTDPKDHTITYSYDLAGHLVGEVGPAPSSYEQSWTYDDGNMTSHVDRAERTTTYDYDGHDLIETTYPDETTTEASYYPNGLLETWTDRRGKVTTSGYDEDWNLDTVVTPLGETTTMTYDEVGQMQTKVDPRGNAEGADPADYDTHYGHDDRGHVSSITDPLGHETVIHFDPAGNRDSVTDPNSHETTYGYDEANHLTLVTDAKTGETHYHYDDAGNLDLRTDANTHETAYTYYADNRLHTTTDPLTNVWTLTYDDAGNLETRTDGNDKTTTYGYDELDRLTSITYDDISTPPVTYDYDAMDHRIEMTDGAGTVTYAYGETSDHLDSIIRGEQAFLYGYDDAGNVTLRQYPDGSQTTYAYDDDGRLESASSVIVPVDQVAPTAPAALSATLNGSDTIDLDWSASTDDVAVTGYRVYLNGGLLFETDAAATEATDVSAPPGLVYSYAVSAIDGAGNESAPSDPATGSISGAGSRYRTEILGDSPVAYWRLGERTGATAADEVAANDGTYVQGYDLGQWAPLYGDGDASAHMDAGSSGYVAVADDSALDLGDGPFSIEFWAARDETDQDGGVIIDKVGGTDGYRVAFDEGHLALIDGHGTIDIETDDPYTDTNWHHYVVTRGSSADGHIYVDGEDETDAVDPVTLTDSNAALDIGAGASGALDPFDGLIDEVAIYDTELSEQDAGDHFEIATTYAASTPPSTPSSLTATAAATGRVGLSWTGSTDDTAVLAYNVYRDAGLIGTTASTSFIDRYAGPGGPYEYTVTAIDGSYHESDPSAGDSVTTPPAQVTTYGYDEAGNLLTEATADGVTATYEYDEAGRLHELANVTGSATLSRTTFKLDLAGNRTVATTTHGTQYYTYDELDRLTDVCYDVSCAGLLTPASCINCVGSPIAGPSADITPNGSDVETTYVYDPVGNRLSETTYLGETVYDYDDGDRIETITPPGASPIAYDFDDNGNQTQAGSDGFSWDLADRLVSATVDSNTEDYTYDGDGVRLAADRGGGDVTKFVVDVNAPFAQTVQERHDDGSAIATYALGTSLTTRNDDEGVTYLHHDPIGSISDVTSYEADPLAWATYQPFGLVRSAGEDGAPTVPFAYAGQYRDALTGLDYLRARRYAAGTGRFLSTDPQSGYPTDPYHSTFLYARQNPMSFVDPTGRISVGACAVINISIPPIIEWEYQPVCVWATSEGEVGLTHSSGGGIGTGSGKVSLKENVSGALVGVVSSGDHVAQQEGEFGNLSVSGEALGGFQGGVSGGQSCGRDIWNVSLGPAAGAGGGASLTDTTTTVDGVRGGPKSMNCK